MPLTLSTRHVGSVYVILCTGRIVYGEDERTLDAALDHAERTFSRIVLNLSGVTRLDSMGLGLLTRHASRLAKRGGAIHLAGSPQFVTTLLDLTKMSAIIRNFESEDEAIDAFLEHAPTQESALWRGPRLLVFDPSADLCTFARTVLSQHGFSVRTTCSFGDAKLLLRVDRADYILVGPCSAQLPSDAAARDFAAVAPQASILQLGSDFKSHDALEATKILLAMFDIGSASQLPT
jgi:anti-anti-sigma factor